MDKGIQIGCVVAQGIQRAQQAAYTGSHHQVYGNLALFQVFEYAHRSGTLGTAAGEHQAHGRPGFPDLGHAVTDFPHGSCILGIQAERGVFLFLGHRCQRQQHEQYAKQSLHFLSF